MSQSHGPQANDVFISYAQADNQFGWVRLLLSTLKALFKSINRDVEPSFHFDERSIRGNDPLDETLKRNVQTSGVLLIVMSENWCDSTYCPLELQWFIEASGGLEQARRRIIILQLSDYSVKLWPLELRQNIAKRFFEENQRTGMIEPISWDFKDAGKPPSVCAELAEELWDCLEGLQRVPPPKKRSVTAPQILTPSSPHQSQPAIVPSALPAATAQGCSLTGAKIFLAEVHRQLLDVRRKLAEDLRREGYQVLPGEREFRNDRAAAETEIPAMLCEADLVVQLYHERAIGTEEFDESFDRWFKEQTNLCGKQPETSNLRWRRQGLLPDAITDLKHRELMFENDVVAENEAQITALVLERIRRIEERARAAVPEGNGRKVLIRTKHSTRALADELSDEIDIFGADSTGVRLEAAIVQENVALATIEEQLLEKSSPAVGYFVVYGDVDEKWADLQMRECRLLALKRRANPPVTAVYVKPADDKPRPQSTPGRFERLRHDEIDKLHLVLKQALEVR